MSVYRRFRRQRKTHPTLPPRRNKVFFESLEPRLLLDADLQTGGVAAAMSAGLEQFGGTVDDFVENETLLDTQLPLIVRSGGDSLLDDYSIAPTIRELLAVDADIDGDGLINGSNEGALYYYDYPGTSTYDRDAQGSDGYHALDFSELFQGKFISELTGFLDNLEDLNSADFVSFLNDTARDLSETYTSPDYPDRSYSLQVLEASDTSTPNQVSFELDFILTFTNELALDLGFTAEDQGIVPGTSLMVDAGVFFTLEFGVLTSGEGAENADFFIDIGNVTVGVDASRAMDDVGDMRIGFLGVDVEPG
ncbi:MAG: LEPR-XLL domain-containing protein, partial [Candidatus Hermodarchaeota archaeon]|nr:LEPR-XLL domain-containing protein [Candidatus Hermodarchaeota archaeon]